MNPLLRAAYAVVGQIARLGAELLPQDSDNKLVRSIAARRGLIERYQAWGRTSRDLTRPLVWLHAPSVGEGLQALPVIEWLRQHDARLQIAFTFFSPSAERFARGLPVDFTDYLPFDVPGEMARALDALRPSVFVFSKVDVWPELVREATNRGVPVTMISATVAASSSRLGGLGAALTRDAYASLAAVGAISDEDAERLVSLGVHRRAITVTGDTRYDQVWARAARARTVDLVKSLRSDRPTLVAGSTWPADEALLLPVWSMLSKHHPGSRLVIAPHEPTDEHLNPLFSWASREGLACARVLATNAADADVVIVDRVGVLGDLYSLATAAYVGGGFHSAGLHSVLEPAAFGAPVIFGPRHDNSREALLLLNFGAGAVVGAPDQLRDAIQRWLFDPVAREKSGASAAALVSSGLGATARSAALVTRALERRGSL